MAIARLIFDSTLKAYSAVLFSDSRLIGMATFVATLFNPKAAVTGLLGVITSNVFALTLGINKERIAKGLYGFNGLLVGLSISLYHVLDINLLVMLLAAVATLLLVTLSIEHILGHFFGLPVLSLPFVVVSIVVYLAFSNYSFVLEKPLIFAYDNVLNFLPKTILFYLKSLAAIFFQTSPWAGLVIAFTLLAFSRLAFLLSIFGFAAGFGFHTALGGNADDISAGIVGFNYILTCVAVGGIFLVPSGRTFALAGVAAVVSALIASFAQIFLVNFKTPVVALPFNTVTLMFLYCARLLPNKNFRVVDFLPGSPESNIDYFKSRLERFGESGLEIRLPFTGTWQVSQAYDGKHTHRDLWRESLDFMAVGPNNELRKGEFDGIEDYYTYGLPVLAPASGVVTKVVHHLEDNALGEVETQHNWGNLVMIQHGTYVYSQISHLRQNSVVVKEGDYVQIGSKIGLAGNSGRSDEPHIHLHFQATPEVGSQTMPMPFTQVISQPRGDTPGRERINFNFVPLERDRLSNITADFNIRSFFSLAPGKKFAIRWQRGKQKHIYETWQARIDLFGNRYLENEKEDRLYFYLARDYFACLDYKGSKASGLFLVFMALHRVPFVSSATEWSDTLSYKHFSSFALRLAKDLAQPFTNRVAFSWQAKLEDAQKLGDGGTPGKKLRDADRPKPTSISIGPQGAAGPVLRASVEKAGTTLFRMNTKLEGGFPGQILAQDHQGELWQLDIA